MLSQSRRQPIPESTAQSVSRTPLRAVEGLRHGDSTAEWQGAHEALRGDDQLWQQAELAGLQLDGQALWEVRLCPACHTSVLRAISPSSALHELQSRLTVLSQSLSTLALLAQGH